MRLGLTYNDVLLVPKKTPLYSRGEADVTTRFTRNISLNIPLVSSNMATVTESRMAIAMARNGGLGVIHQFCSIEEQVEEVKKVKRSTSYVIENPLIVQDDLNIFQAVNIMKAMGVTSLIIMHGDEMVGIFTPRDYLFEDDWNKPVKDVMTKEVVTANYGIGTEEAKKILHEHRIEKLPLMQDGKLRGLITTKDIMKLYTWPNANRDIKGRLRVGAAVGVKDTIERSAALINAGADVIILDVAHAHSEFVLERVREFKKHFNVDLMVGNIATGEAARDLIDAGADGLKIGVGPSIVCSTRTISGAGVPQLTAVMDACEVARRYDVPVCADGGIKLPGDISKALAAGASSVFCGSLFAGTDEAPGIIMTKDGRRYKRYMGSASYDSNHERKENEQRKRLKEKIDVFVEGVAILVDYKGPVEEVIKAAVKGLQSGISYCGGRDIKEMQQNAEFIQITSNGWDESLTHGTKLSE
jgi:IMP dehydrogenase